MSDEQQQEQADGQTVELEYVEQAGPGIPELPPGPPPAAAVDPPIEPQILWEQEQIETFLKGTGEGLHMLAGVAEHDWRMTQKDLERIAPPLTRIANRYEPVLKLAPVADPLLVAHGFALYGWRSALERQRALRDQREQVLQRDGYDVVGQEQPDVEIDEEELGQAGPAYFPDSPRSTST